jgi:CheY-like chemotaxis protein
MNNIFIICVEDEHQVLDVLVKDLEEFEELFPIEIASSADEARDLIEEIENLGGKIGLVLCDHIMPGDNGVDLLIEMKANEFTKNTRKVLITGQAGLEDTVKAVNRAGLNHYIAKPWEKRELLEVVKKELTQFVIESEESLLPFMTILDGEKLQEEIRARGYI